MPAPQEIFSKSEPPLTSGSCLLKIPQAAKIVQKALLFFEGKRYYLSAWCIMPNHIHLILAPIGEHRLSEILHSLKSYTSNQINKALGRKGPLWERESFDHLIRSTDPYEKFISYIELNPVEAGLCQKPEDWAYSSCGAGFQPAPDLEFIEPSKMPFVPLQDRGELPHLYKEGGTYFITFRLADAVVYRKKS